MTDEIRDLEYAIAEIMEIANGFRPGLLSDALRDLPGRYYLYVRGYRYADPVQSLELRKNLS